MNNGHGSIAAFSKIKKHLAWGRGLSLIVIKNGRFLKFKLKIVNISFFVLKNLKIRLLWNPCYSKNKWKSKPKFSDSYKKGSVYNWCSPDEEMS